MKFEKASAPAYKEFRKLIDVMYSDERLDGPKDLVKKAKFFYFFDVESENERNAGFPWPEKHLLEGVKLAVNAFKKAKKGSSIIVFEDKEIRQLYFFLGTQKEAVKTLSSLRKKLSSQS